MTIQELLQERGTAFENGFGGPFDVLHGYTSGAKTLLKDTALAAYRLGLEEAKGCLEPEETVVNYTQAEVSFITGWNENRTATLAAIDTLLAAIEKV